MKKSKSQSSILEQDALRERVRERYGAIADKSAPSCCSSEAESCCGSQTDPLLESPTSAEKLGYQYPDTASAPEGAEMGLGCGNPVALASIQAGETILDLGSGGGFDCFLAARQTGPKGQVIGVDMTPVMISKARQNAAKGKFDNVEFRLGEIENLPVADAVIDLILSNCVINLSPDKPRVFAEAIRVLKPGGRLAISDIVLLQELPEDLRDDFEAFTGCVAGATPVDELRELLRAAGFSDPEVEIKPGSRDFINHWLPGKNAGDYVASASITARKPV